MLLWSSAPVLLYPPHVRTINSLSSAIFSRSVSAQSWRRARVGAWRRCGCGGGAGGVAGEAIVEKRGEGVGTQPRHLDDRSHYAGREGHARQGVRALPESDAS